MENEKWMLAICLMFINGICPGTDCFDRRPGLPIDLPGY
nr:X polypeptide [Escherichia coli]